MIFAISSCFHKKKKKKIDTKPKTKNRRLIFSKIKLPYFPENSKRKKSRKKSKKMIRNLKKNFQSRKRKMSRKKILKILKRNCFFWNLQILLKIFIFLNLQIETRLIPSIQPRYHPIQKEKKVDPKKLDIFKDF